MAGRRPLKPKLHSEYEFSSVEECETSEKYGGLHRIEPTQWPPKSQHGELRPTISARCSRCGGWCIVASDNDANESGIEVVEPVKAGKAPKREPVTA